MISVEWIEEKETNGRLMNGPAFLQENPVKLPKEHLQFPAVVLKIKSINLRIPTSNTAHNRSVKKLAKIVQSHCLLLLIC